MNRQRGKLIVIDGLDGSGKATQAALLLEHLQKTGREAEKISFPDYQNPSSTLVRMYLAGEIGTVDQVNAYAASSFYSVDRYVSFQNIWKTAYEKGHTILADRYTTSNAAHQMGKEPRENWDAFLDWLADFEYNKLGLPKPDLVIYLDMHPNTSRALLSQRYAGDESKRDIHEANLSYLLHCREAALYAAERWDWQVVRCCDGSQPHPIEKIAREVWQIADSLWEDGLPR